MHNAPFQKSNHPKSCKKLQKSREPGGELGVFSELDTGPSMALYFWHTIPAGWAQIAQLDRRKAHQRKTVTLKVAARPQA